MKPWGLQVLVSPWTFSSIFHRGNETPERIIGHVWFVSLYMAVLPVYPWPPSTAGDVPELTVHSCILICSCEPSQRSPHSDILVYGNLLAVRVEHWRVVIEVRDVDLNVCGVPVGRVWVVHIHRQVKEGIHKSIIVHRLKKQNKITLNLTSGLFTYNLYISYIVSEIISSDLHESQELKFWCKKHGFPQLRIRLASLYISLVNCFYVICTFHCHPHIFIVKVNRGELSLKITGDTRTRKTLRTPVLVAATLDM